MVERGEHLRFAPESRQTIGIAGKSVGENLERDIAIETRVVRAIDLTHATDPD